MSLFDFFFPEEAQAAHLRRLADATTASNMRARVNAVRVDASRESNQKRIEELEDEVSQLTIVVEALLEKLNEKGSFTREELAAKIAEIDLRDGLADGKITKELPSEPKPASKPRLLIPEA